MQEMEGAMEEGVDERARGKDGRKEGGREEEEEEAKAQGLVALWVLLLSFTWPRARERERARARERLGGPRARATRAGPGEIHRYIREAPGQVPMYLKRYNIYPGPGASECARRGVLLNARASRAPPRGTIRVQHTYRTKF